MRYSVFLLLLGHFSFAITPGEYCKSLPAVSCEVLNSDVYAMPGTPTTGQGADVGASTPAAGGPVCNPFLNAIVDSTGTRCLSKGVPGTPASLIRVIKQCKNRVFEVKTLTEAPAAGISGNLAGACL
ncbi:MAG: hypothetical protein IPK04_17670 [Bdellovibrionales bacterium]|nr:hypothetical protein [Bdellovibrionales bacterium]